MITYPNCKINLGLKILEKRKDGFHNLESVFLPVPWYDALEIIENKKKSSQKAVFTSTGLSIEGDKESNLCVKAYNLLDDIYTLPPIKMHLNKIIPMGAGLGGGSSDGAFTLKLLNEIFKLELSNTQLQKYASQLGSDCPFFIPNRPSFVTGRGEKLKKTALDLSGWNLLIIHPLIHINTAEAFRNVIRKKSKHPLHELPNWNLKKWPSWIENDFEGYAFQTYPKLKNIKETLYRKGAIYAGMSGSGSAIFGFFHEKIKIPKSWSNYTCFQSTLEKSI